jgi:IS30 family transposase
VAYDHFDVTKRVMILLNRTPAVTQSEASRVLGIDRHTINRALRRTSGRGFRALQDDAIATRLSQLRDSARPLSQKEIAALIGCSSVRAYRGHRRRLESRTGPEPQYLDSDFDQG